MKICLWEMKSSRLGLGSMEVSRGAKDGSKGISKAKQDPNFDLPSLRDRTANVFSTTFSCSISTIDHVNFSSSFHFLRLGVKVFWNVEKKKKWVHWKCYKLQPQEDSLVLSYIYFKVLSKTTLLLANITSLTQCQDVLYSYEWLIISLITLWVAEWVNRNCNLSRYIALMAAKLILND